MLAQSLGSISAQFGPRRRKRRKASRAAPIMRRDGGKTLAKLRADERIQWVDDERQIGNGVLVTLKQGWTWEAGDDVRTRGEDTLTEMLRAMREARPHAGPYYE